MNLSDTKWTAIGPAPTDTPTVGLGFSAGRIEVAAPDPTNADVMYVGANGGGVWKTGVWNNPSPVWLSLTDDQPSLNFAGYHSLVVHPANKNLILGAVSGPGAGILKSTNAGLGWALLANSIFEGALLGSIAVHPTNTQILYVSVWFGGAFAAPGVYKSVNGGASWQPMTSSFHKGPVSDVIVAKFNSQHLYAGFLPGSDNAWANTAGVYISPDAGMTWQVMPQLPTGFFLGDTVRLESSSSTGTLYAALFFVDVNGNKAMKRYRTANGGQTWTALASTPGPLESRSWHVVLAVDPKRADHIFANDAYKLFESIDGGQTWAQAGQQIGDDWVNVTFDANNSAVVTADRSVYTYEPKAKTWTRREGNLQVTQFYDVTLFPVNLDKAYGVAQDHVCPMRFSGNVLWNDMSGSGSEYGRVLAHPTNANVLYASNPLAPADLVRRSTNGGANWTTILTNNAFQANDWVLAPTVQKSFAMDPQDPKRLLIGLTQVFETQDATAANPTWSPISMVLSPAADISGQYITALAIAPSNSKTVYAATADGHVWTTTNGGQTWKANDTGLVGMNAGRVIDLRIDPANAKRVFAVSSGGAGSNIWFLDPATAKWKSICGNMPTNLRMGCICADWKTKTVLYCGTERGVYQSKDLGAQWTLFGQYLPKTLVTDLQTIPALNVLAAGTYGRGAWEILLAAPKGAQGSKKLEGPAKKAPKPRLKPAPVFGSYFAVSDLIRLPGKMPGRPLAGRKERVR